MYATLFQTPILKTLLKWSSTLLLGMAGWECVGKKPAGNSKFILLGVPHTSNWDFVILVLIASKLDLNVYWMGKKQLFFGPLGWFFKWFGGIPIDRSKKGNLVSQIVDFSDKAEDWWLVIAPEGTRKPVTRWKTGFYHISNEGQIPIMLSFIDYEKKQCGLGDIFRTTGDMDADLTFLQGYYGQFSGKRPGNYDPVYQPKD
jgi:1-acyl-sn-glycerol-3-phosphate acyltransferase